MRPELVPVAKLLDQMREDQKRLEQSHDKLMALFESLCSEARRMSASAAGAGQSNLKLMELQRAMQRENLVFTSVSNVLKTRHDTAKNSISNIR